MDHYTDNASDNFTPFNAPERILADSVMIIPSRKTIKAPRAVVALLTILMIITCSDKGDNAIDPPSLGNLMGVWQLSTTVTSNSCGLPNGGSSSELITLIQCGDEISVITGSGLWGSGTIQGEHLDITGIEVQIDSTGCQITRHSSGTFSGNPTLIEGTFTTNVTFDPTSCGSQSPCTVETSASLSLVSEYRASCIDRDDFGDPAVSDYILPWPVGKSYLLNNGYCYPTGGHREQQAYDFVVPIGDTIVAARAGVVRQVKEDSPDNGQGSDHNHVMVEHSDGTTGFYAHLKQWGVFVEIGEDVVSGQPIALAGHSGTTGGVHLHFGVYSYYPPMEGDDRAVNFRNMDGAVDCRGGLVMGEMYTAQ